MRLMMLCLMMHQLLPSTPSSSSSSSCSLPPCQRTKAHTPPGSTQHCDLGVCVRESETETERERVCVCMWHGDRGEMEQQLPTAAGSYAVPAAQSVLLEDMYGERWAKKKARIRSESAHGQLGSWDLISFIVKSGDDLRQEQFAMQMVYLFQDMFRNARTRLWLRPYQVVSTAPDAGLIEVVQDAVSLHHLREKWAELKWPPAEQNLHAYFVKAYGPEHLAPFKAAQRNFIESMAAYAVVCYLLKVKDRNDGNLLLTRDGHMVHIDFGFMLSNTPGDMAFEQAPFKLTTELVAVSHQSVCVYMTPYHLST